MRQQILSRRALIVLLVGILSGLAPLPAAVAQTPRYGGELVFVVGSEMPSYDGHREETFGLMHPAGPHYSTLLRVDPADSTGTRIIGVAGVPRQLQIIFATSENVSGLCCISIQR